MSDANKSVTLTDTLTRMLDRPDGPRRPRSGALRFAAALLEEVTAPGATDIYTDHDGALRVDWQVLAMAGNRRWSRTVELIVPTGAKDARLYFTDGRGRFATEDRATAENMRRGLDWLAEPPR